MTLLGARDERANDDARLRLGRHRARDGTAGGPVGLSVERPHAGVVVGKRGSGKSHTLGVLAEGVAETPGVAAIVIDPMGEFTGLGSSGRPEIPARAVPPRVWPALVGLDPTDPAGGVVWEAMAEAETLAGAVDTLADGGVTAERSLLRVARNHLRRAARWGVFDPDGRTPTAESGTHTVDCAGLPDPAINAVCRAIARACYERRPCSARPDAERRECGQRLPWLFVDEAHVAFEGVAAPALRRLYTRGRTPGVSVVCATQRPTAVPAVAVSQADLLVAHRLTSGADVDHLLAARPRSDRLRERIPSERGTALIVDDATDRSVLAHVRARDTPDHGASPAASGVASEQYDDSAADGPE